jgi:Arc/MetJ-type ribon-helix-helix transcriptional regulator
MAVSLRPDNKRILKRFLKTGRWNNESEILRYGLRWVERELTAEQFAELSPVSAEQLAKALRQLTPLEQLEETRISRASLRHRPRPKDLDK